MRNVVIFICFFLSACSERKEFTPEQIYLLQTTCIEVNGRASIYGGLFTNRPVNFDCVLRQPK